MGGCGEHRGSSLMAPFIGRVRATTGAPHLLGILGILSCVVAVPILVALDGWLETRRMVQAWAIEGLDCPVSATAVTAMRSFRPPHTFSYGGVTFTRRFGHVSCVSVAADSRARDDFARICQFTAPAAVSVQTTTGMVTYAPGVGRPTTIRVVDGRSTCVLGGWYQG